MDLTLTNTDFLDTGIFGELKDSDGKHLFYTLQHAYDSGQGDGSYVPKVPAGTYTCVKGQHQLAYMRAPEDMFEVTNVPGHTGILFHVGNFNGDSEGCILLGSNIASPGRMIGASNLAFTKFMNLQKDINEFTLTVTN